MSAKSDPFVELVAGLLDLAHAAQAFAARPGALEELSRILYSEHRNVPCQCSCIGHFSFFCAPAAEDACKCLPYVSQDERHDENDRSVVEIVHRENLGAVGSSSNNRMCGLPSDKQSDNSRVSLFCIDIIKAASHTPGCIIDQY